MQKVKHTCWQCRSEWLDYPGAHAERAKLGTWNCPHCGSYYWSVTVDLKISPALPEPKGS